MCRRFFTLILLLFMLHSMGIGLFRFNGALCRNENVASTGGAFLFLVLLLLGGFLLAKDDIPPWWIWWAPVNMDCRDCLLLADVKVASSLCCLVPKIKSYTVLESEAPKVDGADGAHGTMLAWRA